MDILKKIIKKLFVTLWPSLCCFCEDTTNNSIDLCGVCSNLLPWIQVRCFICGLRIENENGETSITCEKCQQQPPKFYRLCSLFEYQPLATNLITGLKFGRQLAFGRLLGQLLAEKVAFDWYQKDQLPEAIIPVPLHSNRLKERGFNQSVELSLPLKKQLGIPMLTNVVKRKHATKPQSALLKEYRQLNLLEAFEITRPITFQHIAIVDDVVTTGNTVNSLANTLINAGVERVDIWCVCRA